MHEITVKRLFKVKMAIKMTQELWIITELASLLTKTFLVLNLTKNTFPC